MSKCRSLSQAFTAVSKTVRDVTVENTMNPIKATLAALFMGYALCPLSDAGGRLSAPKFAPSVTLGLTALSTMLRARDFRQARSATSVEISPTRKPIPPVTAATNLIINTSYPSPPSSGVGVKPTR